MRFQRPVGTFGFLSSLLFAFLIFSIPSFCETTLPQFAELLSNSPHIPEIIAAYPLGDTRPQRPSPTAVLCEDGACQVEYP